MMNSVYAGLIISGAMLGTATVTNAATQLVVNGGFETGNFDGWSRFGNEASTFVSLANVAFFGAVGEPGGIFQTIATVPGEIYRFGFSLENQGGTPNLFDFSWDGKTYLKTVDSDYFGLRLYAFTGVATSAHTDLRFNVRNDPSYYMVDDVSVVSIASPVPEPHALPLLLAGLAVVAGVLRVNSSPVRRERRIGWATSS